MCVQLIKLVFTELFFLISMQKNIISRGGPGSKSWLRILLKTQKSYCNDPDFSVTSSSQKTIILCQHLCGDMLSYESLAELELKMRGWQLAYSGTNQ